MKNVTLCTTMWDKIPPEEGERREQELCDKFWATMLKSGATVARHNHTKASAKRVLQRFLTLKGVNLQLADELAEGKTLAETKTGRQINKELIEWQEKAKKEMDQVKADMQQAIKDKDEDMKKMIADEQKKLEERMRQSRADAEALSKERELDQERWRNTFMEEQKRWRDVMAEQNKQHQEAMKEIASQDRGGCLIM